MKKLKVSTPIGVITVMDREDNMFPGVNIFLNEDHIGTFEYDQSYEKILSTVYNGTIDILKGDITEPTYCSTIEIRKEIK